MRLIGELNDSELARKFAAFLLTESIASKTEEEAGVWEVWVKDEDQLDLAMAELEKFQTDPNGAQYSDVFDRADQIIRNQEIKRQQFQKNLVDVKKRVGLRRGPLTMLLIIACATTFLLTGFGKEKGSAYQALSFTAVEQPDATRILDKNGNNFDALGVRLASVMKGEVWRLVTPIFIHFDPMHIIFNMMWLYYLGNMIENRYGTLWLGILILASAVISNCAQSMVPGWMDGSVPGFDGQLLLGISGGMSGVVYALFGFVWMKSVYDQSSGFRLSEITIFIMLGWLVLCMTGVMGSIGNWAHAVGLIVGMVAGYAPKIMGK